MNWYPVLGSAGGALLGNTGGAMTLGGPGALIGAVAGGFAGWKYAAAAPVAIPLFIGALVARTVLR